LNEACVGLIDDCCPNENGIYLCTSVDGIVVSPWKYFHNLILVTLMMGGGHSFSTGCCFEDLPRSGYAKDFTLMGPQDGNDQAKYLASTAPYFVPATAPDGSYPVVWYQRNPLEEFDLIYFQTLAIANASEYVEGTNKFYMDVYRRSTGDVGIDQCTRIILQLDALDLASSAEFPTGRHSRYVAFATTSDSWERLDFVFLDRLDQSVDDTSVTALVLFFDPGALGNDDTFFFRNLDSAVIGCMASNSSSSCEETTPKSCRAFFPGESGGDEVCSDGGDNDSDGMVDCIDTECMLEPICGSTISRSYASAINLMRDDQQQKSSASSSAGQAITGGGLFVLAMMMWWIAIPFS
jgi:hypothetical protein